jgi:hypothetical protein
MEVRVRLRGTGRVEVPAYGLNDAEHQVEKEIRAAWPGAAVEVTDVRRPGGPPRIVEEFEVRYAVRIDVTEAEEKPGDARRAVLRRLRDAFADTRYHRVAWADEEEQR